MDRTTSPLTDDQQAVLDAITAGTTRVADILTTVPVEYSTVPHILDQLTALGLVEPAGYGRYRAVDPGDPDNPFADLEFAELDGENPDPVVLEPPAGTGPVRRWPAWLGDPTVWILTGLAAVAIGLVVGVLWLAWLLLTAVVDGLAGGAAAAGHAGVRLADWMAHGPITGTVTGPVRAYLSAHAGELPADADHLWWAWLALTGGLLALAATGARGARPGWLIAGAATTAMVYAGAPTTGRTLAAGLTVLIWALLSTLAFGGARPARPLVTITTRCPHDDDRRDDQPAQP